MPKGKAVSIEVVVSDGERFVVLTYADGQTSPDRKPRRKPRKPFARAKAASWTRRGRSRFSVTARLLGRTHPLPPGSVADPQPAIHWRGKVCDMSTCEYEGDTTAACAMCQSVDLGRTSAAWSHGLILFPPLWKARPSRFFFELAAALRRSRHSVTDITDDMSCLTLSWFVLAQTVRRP